MGSYLAIEGLIQKYDDREIINISNLEVRRGEVLVVLGPNGAGKSTLLRILNVLEKPMAGKIFFQGKPIGVFLDELEIRRKMVTVFQEPLLFNATVYKNVAFGLKVRHFDRVVIEERVKNILKKLEISHLANTPTSKLSGGEAQRVSLARALVLESELLFLDEPFTFLDVPTREALTEDLIRIIRERNLTVVYVTHSRDEALLMADRIAIMDRGKILQEGSPEEVFNSPASEDVANFVGMETILEGEVIERENGLLKVRTHEREIEVVSESKAQGRILLGIRPENVIINSFDKDGPSSSARNKFKAKMVKIISLGSVLKIYLDCGFPLVSLVTKKSTEELGLEVGKTVVASFKATAVHVFRE